MEERNAERNTGEATQQRRDELTDTCITRMRSRRVRGDRTRACTQSRGRLGEKLCNYNAEGYGPQRVMEWAACKLQLCDKIFVRG